LLKLLSLLIPNPLNSKIGSKKALFTQILKPEPENSHTTTVIFQFFITLEGLRAPHEPWLIILFYGCAQPCASGPTCIMTSSYFKGLKDSISNFSIKAKEFSNFTFQGQHSEQGAQPSFVLISSVLPVPHSL
jgi:hypothetical protein